MVDFFVDFGTPEMVEGTNRLRKEKLSSTGQWSPLVQSLVDGQNRESDSDSGPVPGHIVIMILWIWSVSGFHPVGHRSHPCRNGTVFQYLNYEAHMPVRGCLSNHDREIEQWSHILQETWAHIKYSAFPNAPQPLPQATITTKHTHYKYIHRDNASQLYMPRKQLQRLRSQQNTMFLRRRQMQLSRLP